MSVVGGVLLFMVTTCVPGVWFEMNDCIYSIRDLDVISS
jgi:hypothetical protein